MTTVLPSFLTIKLATLYPAATSDTERSKLIQFPGLKSFMVHHVCSVQCIVVTEGFSRWNFVVSQSALEAMDLTRNPVNPTIVFWKSMAKIAVPLTFNLYSFSFESFCHYGTSVFPYCVYVDSGGQHQHTVTSSNLSLSCAVKYLWDCWVV